MRKDIFIFAVLLFIVVVFTFTLNFNLDVSRFFAGWATSQTFSISITVVCGENGVTDGGGVLDFSNQCTSSLIGNITGLTPGLNASLTIFDSSLPSAWGISKPGADIVLTEILYFDLNVTGEGTGNYTIYFNLTSSQIGSSNINNIRLFTYNTSWEELSTTVLDSTNDPRSFSAIINHFSRFLIGEEPSASPEVSATTSGGGTRLPNRVRITRPEEKPSAEPEEKIPEPIIEFKEIMPDEKPQEEEKESPSLLVGLPLLRADIGLALMLLVSFIVLMIFMHQRQEAIRHTVKRKSRDIFENVNPVILLFAAIISFTFSASATGSVVGSFASNISYSLVLGLVFLIEAFIFFHFRKE